MPSYNLRYRKYKVMTNFIKPIMYYPAILDDLLESSEEGKDEFKEEIIEEEDDINEELNDSKAMLNNLLLDLTKIRRNAKRKLERWVKDNKGYINDLQQEDKTEILHFIGDKYYKK